MLTQFQNKKIVFVYILDIEWVKRLEVFLEIVTSNVADAGF